MGTVIQTKEILKLKTIRNLAVHAEKQAGTELTAQATAFEKQDWYPLTENQMGLYYDWEKNREGLQYNIGASLRFSVHVDVRQLKDAAIAVIEAHPYLKTTLAIRENQVVQLRRDDLPVDILTNQVDEAQMESVLASFVRPFNLFGDTLYRFAIHQTDAYTYFLFDIHHIIFDGTSMSILFNDLKEAFEGKFLTSEGFTAFDRALEEKAMTSTQKYAEAEAYFDNLAGKTTLTAFPSQVQAPSVGTAKNVIHSFRSDAVKAFATGNAVTESNFLMAAFFLVLSRYTREDRIAITSVSSGREENHLSGLMGMFVKTFPVIAELKSLTVLGLVKAIQDQVYATMEHDIFPFTKMAGKYGFTPQVNFVFQGGIDTELRLGQESVRVNFLHVDTVKFPLCAVIFPGPEGYTLTLEFDDALYQESDIRRFANIYAETVLLMTAHANTPLQELSLTTGSMKEQVMQVSLGKKLEHDRSLSLVDLFRQQAISTPDRIAVVFKEIRYSYREIDRLTDRIAAMLVASGVGREIPVGVMIDRSEYMAIFPLAVMKAGGAYMPLDFTMPPDRLDFMVRDAGVRHIVSEGTRVAECLPGFDGIVINREEIPATGNEEKTTLPKPAPDDMFVILYTSGSTGTPKGCILEHRNIVNFCRWYVEDFNVTPQDRSVAYANFAFDAHMMDIYPMITSGASVYILPSEMRMDIMKMNRHMEEHSLTIAFMTTQIGRQFAEDIENKSLRLLSVGGERLLPTKKPPYRFYNGYGPTECSLYSTFYNIEKDYNTSVIGHSLANVSNYIMDQHRQLLPLGVAGELCIGGEGVGRGYLNRDDLNREKFVTWNGQTLYRSGDLARYNEDGEIEYISRLDNQVKLRGLRIELGEIENAMTGFEGVSAAVVDIREIAGLQQLCGYFMAKSRIDPDALKEHLATSLTKYMVPTALIQMENFPLTNNGKVNRKALPTPELERTTPYIAPENEVEKQICTVFSDILNTDKVGILDSFFEIGGSSMTAIKAIIRIINLGYSLQYGDLFKLKTPREVARFLTANKAGGKSEEAPAEDISAYDYSAINRILENARPGLWEDYRPDSAGDVLLTGSTGYLGIHVLRELIRSETGKIYCMVRSKGALSPGKRLQTLLMYYFSDGFDDLFDSRIIPVNGDITNLNTLKSLRGKGIGTVFNCAASVKHFSAGDELQKINVDGVANLVGFCTAGKARLVHVSTQSICGFIEKEMSGRILKIDESRFYVGQMIDNVYAMSKFKAERIVLQAVAEGLDGKVMRVGNLMGRHSDGEFQVNFRSNAFMNTLKAYKVLKMFPLSQLVTPLEMSPVDYTASAIVSLSVMPKEVVICHPYNNYRLNMASVIYAMKQYGFEISLVSDRIFNDHFNDTMQDPRKSEYLSGLLHYRVGENYIETPDDNDYTTTLLYMNGIRWPLVGDDYALRLIGFLDGMGFFDEN